MDSCRKSFTTPAPYRPPRLPPRQTKVMSTHNTEDDYLYNYHKQILIKAHIPVDEKMQKRLDFYRMNGILKTVVPTGWVQSINLNKQLPPRQTSGAAVGEEPPARSHSAANLPVHKPTGPTTRFSRNESDVSVVSVGDGIMRQLPERDPAREIRMRQTGGILKDPAAGHIRMPIILQICGYSKQLTSQDVYEYLQEVKFQTHVDLHEIDIEFAIKGYVYIKFTSKKDAYLFLKKLLQGKRHNSDWENIQADFLPYVPKLDQAMTPLLVFINSKSGGGDGQVLYNKLINCLNEKQVYKLDGSSPCPGLVAFRYQPNYRILACGGDGTCSWVMSILEEMKQTIQPKSFLKMACENPAIGIIPLGTGNDLSRVLGYGGGYSVESSDSVLSYVRKVQSSTPNALDRWSLQFHAVGPRSQTWANATLAVSQTSTSIDTSVHPESSSKRKLSYQQPSSQTKLLDTLPCEPARATVNTSHPNTSNTSHSSKQKPATDKQSTQKQSYRDSLASPQPMSAETTPRSSTEGTPRSMALRKTPTFNSDLPGNRYGSMNRNSYIMRPEFIKNVVTDVESLHSNAADGSTPEHRPSIQEHFEEGSESKSTHQHLIDSSASSDDDKSDNEGYDECRSLPSNDSLGSSDDVEIKCMTNYFSVGLDAELALSFHRAREEHPERFNSRIYNKSVYVRSAIKRMASEFQDIGKVVTLYADNKQVRIPKHTNAIVLSNIPSYGGGQKLWRSGGKWDSCRIDDGRLEVLGLAIKDMVKVFTGIGGARRLAQASSIRVEIRDEVAVQLDGEPWMQEPCTIRISELASKQTVLMKHKK